MSDRTSPLSPRNLSRGTLAALVLTLVVGSPALAAGPAKVVDNFLAAYNAGDVEKMTAIYADDVRFTDVSQRHEVTGRDGMRENLRNLTAIHKQMDVDVKRRAVSGDLVTVEVVYSGTLDCAALGRPDKEDLTYSLPAVLLFEVDKDHIRSQTDYLDFRTFSETFGALQAPAPSH
ncbi:MAG: nuclear transport factor 2 family protein [Acidobacteriota bacterium]